MLVDHLEFFFFVFPDATFRELIFVTNFVVQGNGCQEGLCLKTAQLDIGLNIFLHNLMVPPPAPPKEGSACRFVGG